LIISLFFLTFAGLLLGLFLSSTNPIISIINLILVIIGTAIYIMDLGASFVGLSYIIVYIGAICVLFLYVILLLNMRANIATIPPSIYFGLFIILFNWVFDYFFKDNLTHQMKVYNENIINYTERIGLFLFWEGFPVTFLAIFLLLIAILIVLNSANNLNRQVNSQISFQLFAYKKKMPKNN